MNSQNKYGFVPLDQPTESRFGFVPLGQATQEKKEETSTKPVFKDVSKQFVKGATAGTLGTYGDLLDLFGLQPRKMLPGQRAQYELESQATESELPHLIDTEDISPRYHRVASGQDVAGLIEDVGGPGKAETMAGRYAERIGRLSGGGAALGANVLQAPIIAGSVGQTLEELGAPAWAQAAGEMFAFLTSGKGKVPLTSKSPEVKNKLNELKKLGYSEEDLTLAKNALEERGFLKKVSRLTPKAEQSFKNAISNSESKVNEILNKSFPGLEEGLPSMKKASSEIYNTLDDIARNVVVESPDSFVKSASKAVNELRKSLANTPQEKQVIELLENAMKKAGEFPTADEYINFYQGLNQIGNWSNPRQREHVFKIIQDAIKQTFRDQGPIGQKLASKFEEANQSWKKFRQAEDVSELIGKATSDEGINFSKLSKMMENPSNFETLSDGLGKVQANNIKLIAQTGSEIGNLEKIMKGGLAKEALGAGKLLLVAKAIVTGDLSALKTYVGTEALGRLSTKLLTDPKWQNLQLKALEAVKNGKWDQLRAIATNFERLL